MFDTVSMRPYVIRHVKHGPYVVDRWLACLAAVLMCAACAVPVATGLENQEADRVVVALDHAGVDGVKEVDPTSEGRWRVNVPRDEVARSLIVLPRRSFLERARSVSSTRWARGRSSPARPPSTRSSPQGWGVIFQRSLEGVDGILSARVHLNLPSPSPMRETPTGRASASVRVEYRGGSPPITSDDVQRLVSGACTGLTPADVAVVMVSRPTPARPPGSELAHVGPLAVAHGSAHLLQGMLLGFLVLLMGLAVALLVVGQRLSTLRQEAAALATPTVKR